MKPIVIMVSLILSQNILAATLSQGAACNSGGTPKRECIPISCGKTVICEESGNQCTMLDGDYNLFKMGIRGSSGSPHSRTYTIEKITVMTSTGKGAAICHYSSHDGFNEFVQFYNKPNTEVFVLQNTQPDSPDYGWIVEKMFNGGLMYNCDATKFVCQMYY